MFLNIITPCSRPTNLLTIEASINIPRSSFRWIVVIDSKIPVSQNLLPISAEVYYHVDSGSISGNAQRNFALDLIEKGHILFNDDDTTLHPDFWSKISDCSQYDFITYPQLHKNGTVRLLGDLVRVGHIDSHNFVVHNQIIGQTRWKLDKYEADGIFAEECFKSAKTWAYVEKALSTYNTLR
jgi:hypothetical protein